MCNAQCRMHNAQWGRARPWRTTRRQEDGTTSNRASLSRSVWSRDLVGSSACRPVVLSSTGRNRGRASPVSGRSTQSTESTQSTKSGAPKSLRIRRRHPILSILSTASIASRVRSSAGRARAAQPSRARPNLQSYPRPRRKSIAFTQVMPSSVEGGAASSVTTVFG